MTHSTGVPEGIHLNNHHTDTLKQIFKHPTAHNVRWVDAISLLEYVGTVEEKHNGRFQITVGDESATYDKPKGHDLLEEQVHDIRRMLQHAGFGG